jgi:hypothetical protein
MVKMKFSSAIKIIKDILTKTCVYYTFVTLAVTAVASFFSLPVYPGAYLVFALAALGAGVSVQIFKIEKLPAVSKHIAFFILIYLNFLLVVLPMSEYQMRQSSVLLLSVAFITIYIVIFGIFLFVKFIVGSIKNKKLKYENQFQR